MDLAQKLAKSHAQVYVALGIQFSYWRGKALTIKEIEYVSLFHRSVRGRCTVTGMRVVYLAQLADLCETRKRAFALVRWSRSHNEITFSRFYICWCTQACTVRVFQVCPDRKDKQ